MVEESRQNREDSKALKGWGIVPEERGDLNVSHSPIERPESDSEWPINRSHLPHLETKTSCNVGGKTAVLD